MDEEYLMIEQGEGINTYYLACTKNGAIYYGQANQNMELISAWKLVSLDEDTMETIH